jgi:hypothetical protein
MSDMSEHVRPRHEAHKPHENLVEQEHHERVRKHHEAAAEHAKRERSEANLAKLREMADAEAVSAVQTRESEPESPAETSFGAHHALKTNAFDQSMKRIRRKLPAPARAFSKVAHNDVVETISSVGAQTIARPSGLLGGSLCAFIGSASLLYAAKHYGFRYNYLVFVLLFAGGFMIGSLLELLIWLARGRRQQH